MRNQARALSLMLLALSASWVGCACRPESQTRVTGEIGVVTRDASGAAFVSRDAVYDFGPVFVGAQGVLELEVQNTGLGGLILESLTKEGGAPVVIGDTHADPEPVFDVRFVPTELGASETARFAMTFTAPPQGEAKAVPHEVTLVLRGANTAEGAETARITLKATAVSSVCRVPSKIDFGGVAKGDTARFSQELPNVQQVESTATVGDIYGNDQASFGFDPSSPRGSFTIPPMGARSVVFTFRPTELREYLALVDMRASADCPNFKVQLVGAGVEQVLTWEPRELDFGYAAPGATLEAELTFKNAGQADIVVSHLAPSPAEFKLVGSGASVLVPKQGQGKVKLSFQPTALGAKAGQLSFHTDLASQSAGLVPLKGFGGGADIHVLPAGQLGFGKVAYFAGTNQSQTRKLTVLNVGAKPPQPDARANLKLGKGGAGQPYFEVKTVSGDPSELAVEGPAQSGPGAYDPSVGIEATAGRNYTELVVRLTPKSVGPKQFTLTVFSNDADEPEVQVAIQADVVTAPPCNYALTPTTLHFGVLTAPASTELGVTLTNRGVAPGEVCLVSSADVAAGSHGAFSLPAGPLASKELQPGESLLIPVRAKASPPVPATPTDVTGQLELFVASPTSPRAVVDLKAKLGSGCLTIAPDDFDFGAVALGCNSATRTFTVYNTCSSPVVVTGISVDMPAGQAAGGPNCAGASACPEFQLVSTPAISAGGLSISPGAQATFSARYRPIDLGDDVGAIGVKSNLGAQQVTYVVALKAKGDPTGQQTDTFEQDADRRADVLFVIDNSNSMADEQKALGDNFASFIQYAVAADIDFHIAVTTTDMGSGGAKGAFTSGPNHPETVLYAGMADLESKFKAKVNVGIGGGANEMAFEPALKALTPPLVSTVNDGFLRDEATLAVVAVTDETEQSSGTVDYYVNRFVNIKGTSRRHLFSFNAIAGFFAAAPSGCQATPDDGRFADMVRKTGGFKESICTPNWSNALQALGKAAFGSRSEFQLTAVPNQTGGNRIVMKINGVELPQMVNGAQAWSYSPVTNAVKLEPQYVPAPGDQLTISYRVTCF